METPCSQAGYEEIPETSPPAHELGSVDRPILTGFLDVVARTAKCDVCNMRNSVGMSRCLSCGWQTCHPCTVAHGCSRTHSTGGSYHTGPIIESDLTKLSPKAVRYLEKRRPVERSPPVRAEFRNAAENNARVSKRLRKGKPKASKTSMSRVARHRPSKDTRANEARGDQPEIDEGPAMKSPNASIVSGRTDVGGSAEPASRSPGTPSTGVIRVAEGEATSLEDGAYILLSFCAAALRNVDGERTTAQIEALGQEDAGAEKEMPQPEEAWTKFGLGPSELSSINRGPESATSSQRTSICSGNEDDNNDNDYERDAKPNEESDSDEEW